MLQTGGPSEVQNKLMANPDYKQLFADEIERLMFNGGVLTPQVAGSIFSQRASELNVAIIGESARWGDNRHSTTPYTAANRNANVQNLLDELFSAAHANCHQSVHRQRLVFHARGAGV